MAKFVKQSSDVAVALNRLQDLASQFISATTARQVQLGREKEARMVDAYQYLLSSEDAEINRLETSLGAIEQNLQERGVELKSLGDEYKTIDSEALLAAANEGAAELLNVKLNDRRNYRNSLQSKKVNASSIKRNIDLLDEALSQVDPNWTGDKNIVEASDVAHAADKFKQEFEISGPEIDQRLAEMSTQASLDSLQADYFSRLKEETQQKIDAHTASQVEASIQLTTLEPAKKEAIEGVVALFNQGNSLSKLREQLGAIITRQGEIDTDDNLNTSELQAKENEIMQEQLRIGSFLYPWSLSKEEAILGTQSLQQALFNAIKNGNFHDLINYVEIGNLNYNMMEPQMAAQYKTDVLDILGIDISSSDFLSRLKDYNSLAGRIDIKQAEIQTKISETILPEYEFDDNRTNDLDAFFKEEF
jgi:hypothetical protein